MRDSLLRMRKADLDVISMRMEIFISENFPKTKNTVKAPSTGLVFVRSQRRKILNNFSNIMGNGGVDFQMEKVNTSRQMVYQL